MNNRKHHRKPKRYRVVGESLDLICVDLWAASKEQALEISRQTPIGLFEVIVGGEAYDTALRVGQNEHFAPVNSKDYPFSTLK